MSTETVSSEKLTEKGYKQSKFKRIETKPNITLPVSNSAKYMITSEFDLNDIKNQLCSENFDYVNKIHDEENNMFTCKLIHQDENTVVYVRLFNNRLDIYPEDTHFNKNSLRGIINSVSEVCEIKHHNTTEN